MVFYAFIITHKTLYVSDLEKTGKENLKKDKVMADKSADNKGERIAKALARAGLCSRREAERWIEAGRVAVNGRVLDSPACVVSDADEIIVDGKPLPAKEHTRLFIYHKPAGLVTTNNDEKNRPTVFEKLPAHMPRVVSVGRLDMNTEGLLLLTNDGELARHLELPSSGWVRTYRVRVHGKVDAGKVEKLSRGITWEGVKYAPAQIVVESQSGANSWLTISLKEGKNREVRNLMRAIDLQVNRLIRVSYGPFLLGKLAKGEVKEIDEEALRKQIPDYKGQVKKPSSKKEHPSQKGEHKRPRGQEQSKQGGRDKPFKGKQPYKKNQGQKKFSGNKNTAHHSKGKGRKT